MDFVEIGVLVAIWGMFGFNIFKEYKKTKKENRRQLFNVKEFEFWEESMRIMGILLFVSGLIIGISLVKHIGAYLLVAGWLLSGIILLGKRNNRGYIIMAVALLFGFIYYLIWF
ncbi:hypothetical protein [Bacillus sinesaloumensis]|uniref:hypothetical protein n=1 Tax=Litchfieldia sinesaloumensis TaxID=1926280 RepID=UPI0009886C74|nr:hypothetical protein [Bacillus sinesaloumensis]